MRLKFLLLFLLAANIVNAQSTYFRQYFDGADTAASNSIFVTIDSPNTWQIGKPQKTIFHSAATVPNALVTDTINYYPRNDSSTASFEVHFPYMWGILAVQWKQKIDFDKKTDGGIIEFSLDTGHTWHNAFNNPYVYNFYGYQAANKDTLVTGEYAFSGTDTSWRDIWLCFDYSFLGITDSPMFRFRMKTDTVDTIQREGWLIDNLIAHRTLIHGLVKDPEDKNTMKVFPSTTTGIVNIEAEKLEEYHIIRSLQVIDVGGRVVQQYGTSPVKFFIDLSSLVNGLYYIRVETNLKTEVVPVLLNK